MGKFYAVYKGRNPGVYKTWNECKIQVDRFAGSLYKSFVSKSEAEYFVKHGTCQSVKEPVSKNSKSKTQAGGTEEKNEYDTDTLLEIFGNDDLSEEEEKSTKLNLTLNYKPKFYARKRSWNSDAKKSKRIKLIDVPPNTSTNNSSGLETYSTCMKNGMNFTVDDKGKIVVYTDGACPNNGKKKGQARAGYGVWWGENHPFNLSRKLSGIQTNQRAEIAAVNAAIGQAVENNLKKITIKTDSMFIINCVTKWIPGWKRNGWKKADGNPVIHKTEFLKMLEGLKIVDVNWVHVRGHQGIYGNEMADKLAVMGASL